MDPLDCFRAAVSAKYDIKPVNASGAPTSSLRSATHLRLSTAVTFPINTPTRLRKVGSTATDPVSEPDGFFMLEAVYLAWSLRDTPGGEYMKQAREHGFPAGGFVGLTERKSIVDWLKRAVTVLDSVVPLSESTTPPGSPPPSVYRHLPAPSSSVSHTQALPSTSSRSRGDAGPTASPPKRRYVPDAADVEVVKKIRQSEVELRDHNTVLRGIKNNNFSSVRNAYVAKLKSLKEAKRAGAAAPVATQLPDSKTQARKQKNMYPIIMISSSPTSLITMYNVRRFLQESMHVLSTIMLLLATDLTKYPLIDSSHLQRHVPVLPQRVRLGQRISYLSIENVQRLSPAVKRAQARNDIMSSIRLRPSTSLAQMPGIVSSAS
jgi:parafibromin